MRKVRVAAVQAAPVLFDLTGTLDRVRSLLREAASGGAQLAVFPEAFVGGYPKGLDFGVRVGSRTPEGRRWFQRYFESSLLLEGGAFTKLQQAVRDSGIHAVIGAIERDGATLYCSALFFAPDGNLLGKHRKVMPTGAERLIWGYGDGSTLTVLNTSVGRLGAVICWENYMPQLRLAMYAKGVEIYCAPTVDSRDTWTVSMRHIACEGRCFVVSAVQFLRRSDCPPGYPVDAGAEEIPIRGGSVIVDPFGQVLAGPEYNRESILHAELDLDEIVRGKFDLDVVGHYARPDIFRLTVDERPRAPVESDAGPNGCGADATIVGSTLVRRLVE